MALSSQSLKKYRTLLLEQHTNLKTQMDTLQAENADANEQEGLGVSNHPADEASETFLVERNLAVSTDLQRELDEIERALQRIDEGTYGVCEVDGEPIDTARLDARPSATLCIQHQREREQQT